MIPALVGVLALAVWLALLPPGGPRRRLLLRIAPPPAGTSRGAAGRRPGPGVRQVRVRGPALLGDIPGRTLSRGPGPGNWKQRGPVYVPVAVLVGQAAALLRGGRAAARLWDELWLLYGGCPPGTSTADVPPPALTPASRAGLAAARAAAGRGAPVGEAIRRAVTVGTAGPAPASRAAHRDSRAWIELAACFDVAEASGCPLADVLTRFASQLEAEEDAAAARRTALAGPNATVRLLGWLPVLGLGLGMLLGADPVRILLGEPAGLAALAAGGALTAAGRIWSARLVRSAAGHPR